MSNQQVDEKAMVLSPRQEHLQRLRDDMAPGNQPAAIVPRTFAELITMCQALAAADLAPKAMRGKATDMALVIMTGAEVGLPPMASLRLYTTWDGVPRLMAEGVRAIILQSPAVEYFEMATCDDNHATWIGKRRGRPEKSATWTIERAKKAGLLNKENWSKYPQDMLNARASMQLGRIIAPDVVAGMVALEEARDGDFIEAQSVEAKPTFVAPPPPHGPPPGVPTVVGGSSVRVDGPPVAQNTVTVTDTGTKPAEQKRGPGRPPKNPPAPPAQPSRTPGTDPFRAAREATDARDAARPTTPASAPAPAPQPSASTSPAATGSTSEGASAASSPTTDRWGQPVGDPTSGGGSAVASEVASATPSETSSTAAPGAPADDGFGGEDPEDSQDSQPAPTGDPGLALIAEFQAFLAGCKDQKEMQAGSAPFRQRSAALFRGGDQRFKAPQDGSPAGELAARMGQLWAERKSQVPV